ncbi:MAG: response regulator [Planctomycetes bacterium]|nr:response regulator [Planctomycetota bacterium]
MIQSDKTSGDAVNHPKTVLLVDDDLDYRTAIRAQLVSAGFQVIDAESVSEAKARLEECRPDLAIVDLMLEESDGGFSLCYQIKKRDASLPVIMVSAVTSETGLDFDVTTREERSWIRADAWLAKPIRFEQLMAEIKKLLKD